MTIEPDEADSLLQDVAGAEARTRQFLVYARTGDYMILWGVLLAIGYGVGGQAGAYTATMWYALQAIGIAGTATITYLAQRCISPARSRLAILRTITAIVAMIAFGSFWIATAHFTGREQSAFWPTFGGALLFCFGLWAGRVISIGAALVVALTLAGFFWSGPWFDLWLAVTMGGALILGGLWLRR